MLVETSDENVCILEVVFTAPSTRRNTQENTMEATVVSQSALRRLPLRLIDANTKLKSLLKRPCTSLISTRLYLN